MPTNLIFGKSTYDKTQSGTFIGFGYKNMNGFGYNMSHQIDGRKVMY